MWGTGSRVLAFASLVVSAGALAIVLLPEGDMTYALELQDAGQLVRGADVTVGGHAAGSVTDIELTPESTARVTFSIDRSYAPLHDGTTASVRALALVGVASRSLALNPGPNDASKLAEGATIPLAATSSPVDLDAVFDTFGPGTRRDLRNLIHGLAVAGSGRTAGNRRFVDTLDPALATTTRLADELGGESAPLARLLDDASAVTGTLTRRRSALGRLLVATSITARGLAAERASLGQALRGAPPTLRAVRAALDRVRGVLPSLSALLGAARRSTGDLPGLLATATRVLRTGRPTLQALAAALAVPGRANDLPELFNAVARLGRSGGRELDDMAAGLRAAIVPTDALRPYAAEIGGLISGLDGLNANYDANGHYARVAVQSDAFALEPNGDMLTPQPTSQRRSGTRDDATRRCPGAVGGTPVPLPGCDPSATP